MTAAAARDAEAAARRAGVDVQLASDAAETRAATALWSAVWPKPNGEPAVPPEIARAVAHSGNYLSVARRHGDVVGASMAFRGVDEHGPLLHSHIAGVLPGREHAGVGAALKLHQRAWALDQGIDRIVWTFDPLVARNAFFNLTKLGAAIVEYLVDFYGPLDDGINGGDETDRAVAAAAGRLAAVVPGPLPCVLCPDERGRPRAQPLPDASGAVVQVPADIVAVRAADPPLGAAWRTALREVLLDAFGRGWTVAGATRDGCYLLERG